MSTTIGSHPGAILFRLSIMVILIAFMVVAFFSYLGKTERALERSAIQRTQTLVNGSLAVVFATHAVRGELGLLPSLAGANPFAILQAHQLDQAGYRGEYSADRSAVSAPGWYYDALARRVVYLPRFLDGRYYFSLQLKFDDIGGDQRFDQGRDRVTGLVLIESD